MNLVLVFVVQFILIVTSNAQYHTTDDDGLYYPRMGKRALTDILLDSSINQLKGKKDKNLKFIYEVSKNDVDIDDYNMKKTFVFLMTSPFRKFQKTNHLKWLDDSSNEYYV